MPIFPDEGDIAVRVWQTTAEKPFREIFTTPFTRHAYGDKAPLDVDAAVEDQPFLVADGEFPAGGVLAKAPRADAPDAPGRPFAFADSILAKRLRECKNAASGRREALRHDHAEVLPEPQMVSSSADRPSGARENFVTTVLPLDVASSEYVP